MSSTPAPAARRARLLSSRTPRSSASCRKLSASGAACSRLAWGALTASKRAIGSAMANASAASIRLACAVRPRARHVGLGGSSR
eukprot:706110-Prymnesium_polylepis.1